MAHILGVDAGGSKTLAVVGDETGRVLGIGRAGCGNHQSRGLAAAMDQVRLAAAQALEMAGVTAAEVASYCLAGADLPEDFVLLRPAVEDLGLAARACLRNDIAAVLRSGSDSPNAVVVGWGSGVNAMGRNAAGEEIRLPALGWYSGDWGGGSDLGREAIWLVARAHDGRGEPTALQEPVLRAFGVSGVEEMIRKLYFHREERWGIHRLAPIVFQVAAAGDCAARGLVERAAEETVLTAVALLRRLDLLVTPADVVLGGSIFRARDALLIGAVGERLRERAPRARVVIPDVEPVVGAYFYGLDMLEEAVGCDVRARAAASFAEMDGRAEEMR